MLREGKLSPLSSKLVKKENERGLEGIYLKIWRESGLIESIRKAERGRLLGIPMGIWREAAEILDKMKKEASSFIENLRGDEESWVGLEIEMLKGFIEGLEELKIMKREELVALPYHSPTISGLKGFVGSRAKYFVEVAKATGERELLISRVVKEAMEKLGIEVRVKNTINGLLVVEIETGP